MQRWRRLMVDKQAADRGACDRIEGAYSITDGEIAVAPPVKGKSDGREAAPVKRRKRSTILGAPVYFGGGGACTPDPASDLPG
jgi:hypothetical protein